MLFVGDSDIYGTAYGYVGMIYDGLPDALLMFIQSALV